MTDDREARRISSVLATAGIHVGRQFQAKRDALAATLAASPHAGLLDARSMILLAREGRARGFTAVPVWILGVLEDPDWPSVISGLRKDRAPVASLEEQRAAALAAEKRGAEIEGVSLEEWRLITAARALGVAVFDDRVPLEAAAARAGLEIHAARALLDRATLERCPELACGTATPAEGAYARWKAREDAAAAASLERWRAARERHTATPAAVPVQAAPPAPAASRPRKPAPKRGISGEGKRGRP